MKSFSAFFTFVAFCSILDISLCAKNRLFGCISVEPVCPNENISFYLYTQDTQYNPQKLDLMDPEAVKRARYADDAPMKILIHGFTGDKDYSPNSHIRPAYFENGEYNIISVEYGVLVKSPCYISAVRNLPTVSNCTAQLINFLIDQELFDLESIHVIGFSLGAHVAGMIANYMPKGRKLKRITGLDPAKPLFINVGSESRIDFDDAEFVDIIHTDVFDRGLLVPLGDVDFYVNGGFNQPGCHDQDGVSPGSCNHDRAPVYYAESINSEDGFWGFRCAHWYLYVLGVCKSDDDDALALMGSNADSMSRGLYFLSTNKESPYARGQDFSSNKWMFSDWYDDSDYGDNRI